ncbi:hypothetical protein [Nocardia sp. NPDC049149]|uniref:hypothetical protein n=1 Tax=Nocardia sp. NPDC049149 TaxID=3364315 RepID=UPI0037158E48
MLAEVLATLGAVADRTGFDRLLARVGGLHTVCELLSTSETVIDVGEWEPEAVREWLRALPIAECEQVVVAWPADATAARMRFEQFADCFDLLWFPAQDDVLVVAEKVGAVEVLVLDHEERFAYARMAHRQPR